MSALNLGALKNTLNKLEARLQEFIEGRTARLFNRNFSTADLASKLVDALQQGIEVDGQGSSIAPDSYTICMHPENAASFGANVSLLEALALTLEDAGQEAGLIFTYPPKVNIAHAHDLSLDDYQVHAQISLEPLTQTDAHEVFLEENSLLIPENAFLIVDGTRIFSLETAVVNIGRQEDNHLVIEDPRVSRQHAQLRVVKGHYVIFDLSSTGGTTVNGENIQQQTLYPGDVIMLSGVPLVFGQDASGHGETQEYNIHGSG